MVILFNYVATLPMDEPGLPGTRVMLEYILGSTYLYLIPIF